MSFIETVSKKLLRKAAIIYKEQISESVYHIRIQSRGLKNVSYRPGYVLRVFCGMGKDAGRREKARSYSVWNFNRADQTIDMAVNTYSRGLGANWAKLCKAGDTVYFAWHKGEFTIDHTGDHYLLIGDLCTLPHFYEINRHLSPGKNVDSLIYSRRESDLFLDIDGQAPFNFHQQSVVPTDAVIEKLSAFLLQPAGKRIAYIGGDNRVCLSVNRYFQQEIQKSNGQIRLKPFWAPVIRALK
jgi:NADPH-dependent ferric siderophore reductase